MKEHQFKLVDPVIKRCLECMADDAYVRIGYVISDEMKLDEDPSFYKAISAHLVKNGKYIREKHINSKDFDILPNPNYELSQGIKRTNKLQRRILIITTIISGLTLLISIINLWIAKSNQGSQKELQELRERLTTQERRLDSLNDH